jgi:hypothetical protein
LCLIASKTEGLDDLASPSRRAGGDTTGSDTGSGAAEPTGARTAATSGAGTGPEPARTAGPRAVPGARASADSAIAAANNVESGQATTADAMPLTKTVPDSGITKLKTVQRTAG